MITVQCLVCVTILRPWLHFRIIRERSSPLIFPPWFNPAVQLSSGYWFLVGCLVSPAGLHDVFAIWRFCPDGTSTSLWRIVRIVPITNHPALESRKQGYPTCQYIWSQYIKLWYAKEGTILVLCENQKDNNALCEWKKYQECVYWWVETNNINQQYDRVV